MIPESLADDSTDENFLQVVSPLFLGFFRSCGSSFWSAKSSMSTMVYDWRSLDSSLAALLALLDLDLRDLSLSAPSAAGSLSSLSAGNGKAMSARECLNCVELCEGKTSKVTIVKKKQTEFYCSTLHK